MTVHHASSLAGTARLRDLVLPLFSRSRDLDLNYLYYRHGASLMRAKAATSSCARIVHEKLAEAYARLIADAFPVGEPNEDWTRSEDYLVSPGADHVGIEADQEAS